MRARLLQGLLPALILLFPLPVAAQAVAPTIAQAPPSASAILAAFDALAGQPLWPGFEPRSIPVAIYDGEQTWLVRHPAPPAGFVRKSDFLWAFPGQHPEMRANTSTEIGGVRTATLLPTAAGGREARGWAAVLIHETFHVFQRDHHPAWSGNEAELFVYPMDDAALLAQRRLETEAVRRAVSTVDSSPAACWAARALELRRLRFAHMPAGSAGYERGTELNEGLAAYVEAAASRSMPALPAEGYAADQIRQEAYGIGSALAALLDRFDPTWKQTLESGSAASLDELLAVALPFPDTAGCRFTPEENARALARAAAEADRLVAGRKERRAAFFARPGLRLVIDAGPQPLGPQGFDPMNVESLGNREVLHRRWLKLGNDRGTLEVLGREALTEGAGDHPLFNGVRLLTLSGLAAEPKINRKGEALEIDTEGFKATFTGAVAARSGGVIRITWPEGPPPAAGATPPRE